MSALRHRFLDNEGSELLVSVFDRPVYVSIEIRNGVVGAEFGAMSPALVREIAYSLLAAADEVES